jgi:hypothetical protein
MRPSQVGEKDPSSRKIGTSLPRKKIKINGEKGRQRYAPGGYQLSLEGEWLSSSEEKRVECYINI